MSNELFEPVIKGAAFSKCRRYRYALWRIWDQSKKGIVFIGLNPSTANEYHNDRTINRVINFAQSWGYGSIHMMNLFAFVTSKPSELAVCEDPILHNDTFLAELTVDRDILFAWGAFKQAKARAEEIIKRFPDALCLRKNADGSPIHPLYVRGDTKPFKYSL
jgi:hypothetical protein